MNEAGTAAIWLPADAMICAWLSKCRRLRGSESPRQQGIIEPSALSVSGGHDWMFEQHARWLEELQEYTDRKEAVTCRASYMPLTAIAQEVATMCADARVHDHMQIDSWDSIAADLSDSLDWIGPDLLALVDTPARAVHKAITNGVLVPRPGARPRIDDSKRPFVATLTAVLAAVLDQDDVLVAAWRDLPHAALVVPYNPQAKANLTEAELADLAARCIVERPSTGDYVVWFRLSEGYFVGRDPCATHGDITFYEAQALAQLLIHQDQAREVFDVVPEELLTDEIRDLQRSNNVNEHTGFEYRPGLVYARIIVDDVERHRAVETARMHLDSVLAVVGVHEHMWKVLGGHLFFDGSPWNPSVPRWGLKQPRPETVFYQNDHFARDLADFTANGHLITAETAHQLQPALQLTSALNDSPRADSEAIVMASVRAIEHCNTWTAPHWRPQVVRLHRRLSDRRVHPPNLRAASGARRLRGGTAVPPRRHAGRNTPAGTRGDTAGHHPRWRMGHTHRQPENHRSCRHASRDLRQSLVGAPAR